MEKDLMHRRVGIASLKKKSWLSNSANKSCIVKTCKFSHEMCSFCILIFFLKILYIAWWLSVRTEIFIYSFLLRNKPSCIWRWVISLWTQWYALHGVSDLANYLERSPSWKPTGSFASREMPYILWIKRM